MSWTWKDVLTGLVDEKDELKAARQDASALLVAAVESATQKDIDRDGQIDEIYSTAEHVGGKWGERVLAEGGRIMLGSLTSSRLAKQLAIARMVASLAEKFGPLDLGNRWLNLAVELALKALAEGRVDVPEPTPAPAPGQ